MNITMAGKAAKLAVVCIRPNDGSCMNLWGNLRT